MITVAEAFETFRQKLELTKTESEDAQRRHTEVRECICASFRLIAISIWLLRDI